MVSHTDEGPSYVDGIREWQSEREASLRSRDGWLSIAGFSWLEPGETTLGGGDSDGILLPDESLPAAVAAIDVKAAEDRLSVSLRALIDGAVRIDDQPLPIGEVVPLQSDASGAATRFGIGRLTAWLIERGGKPALRLKDPESPLFDQLEGLEFFPPDDAWVLEGRYERFEQPVKMEVPSVLGYVDTTSCYGEVAFEWNGERHTLWPMTDSPEDRELFLVFADGTSGTETYGAGRFLAATVEEDGSVRIDFNRAYNPPCAYNPFTTCPLPPKQNDLPFSVVAGERLPRMTEPVRH